MTLLTLMVLINYAFISLCVYISFLSAYTFRALFINLNYMGRFGYILSLPPSSLRKKHNFYMLPDGCVGCKIKKKNLQIRSRPSGVLVGSS